MKTKIRLVGRKIVETDAIIFLKADANYTEVHMENGEKIVVSKTLKELEKTFIVYAFFRCHKSYMVNLNQVKGIQLNGGTMAKLSNNTFAEVSRRRKDAFINAMKAHS